MYRVEIFATFYQDSFTSEGIIPKNLIFPFSYRSHLEASAPPQHAAPYFPGSAAPPQPYASERHFCLMCRTDFTDKAEFMFHVRSHFEPHAQQTPPQHSSGKQGGDPATAELIARGLVDPSGLCS